MAFFSNNTCQIVFDIDIRTTIWPIFTQIFKFRIGWLAWVCNCKPNQLKDTKEPEWKLQTVVCPVFVLISLKNVPDLDFHAFS